MGSSSSRQKKAQPPILDPCLLWPNGCIYQDTTWYGGRPQPRRYCVRWELSSPPLKEHSPQFLANVRCGQTAGWAKMSLGVEVGLGPGDFVFDGDTALPPPKKKGTAPISGPYLLWPNGWMDQDATWCGGRPRPRQHCVRWGPCSPAAQNGHTPQFSAHVYCGQTAVCIRIRLGTEVVLSLGDIVLDGDSAPLPLKGHGLQFGPMSVVAKRLSGLRCHLYRGRPRPRRFCVRWGPSSSPKGVTAPTFRSASIVAKRQDG